VRAADVPHPPLPLIQCPISIAAPNPLMMKGCYGECYGNCHTLRVLAIKAVSPDLFFGTGISSLAQGNSDLLSTNTRHSPRVQGAALRERESLRDADAPIRHSIVILHYSVVIRIVHIATALLAVAPDSAPSGSE
jgi:hypothetical protein